MKKVFGKQQNPTINQSFTLFGNKTEKCDSKKEGVKEEIIVLKIKSIKG